MATNSRKETMTVASDGQSVEEVYASNQKSVQEMLWALDNAKGDFALIFAHCNYQSLRETMVTWLHKISSVKIRKFVLKPSAQTL